MPFSQIIPPSPSRTESKRLFYTSVSLLLSCIQGYHSFMFLQIHICKSFLIRNYCIFSCYIFPLLSLLHFISFGLNSKSVCADLFFLLTNRWISQIKNYIYFHLIYIYFFFDHDYGMCVCAFFHALFIVFPFECEAMHF